MKIIYLLAVVILGTLFGFIYKNVTQTTVSPSETVKRYYELAKEGKVEEASAFWTDADCQNINCPRATQTSGENANLGRTKQISSIESYEIENEKIEGNQASVLVLYKINGWKIKTIYKLVKIDGKWMLNSFSSPAMEEADRNAEKIRQENEKENK